MLGGSRFRVLLRSKPDPLLRLLPPRLHSHLRWGRPTFHLPIWPIRRRVLIVSRIPLVLIEQEGSKRVYQQACHADAPRDRIFVGWLLVGSHTDSSLVRRTSFQFAWKRHPHRRCQLFASSSLGFRFTCSSIRLFVRATRGPRLEFAANRHYSQRLNT